LTKPRRDWTLPDTTVGSTTLTVDALGLGASIDVTVAP
jgi:hypothetical protein